MIHKAELVIDSDHDNKVEQIESTSWDELWFRVNVESLSRSIHRFCLFISYQNESGNHTLVEEYSFDYSTMPLFNSNHVNPLIRMKWVQPLISVFLHELLAWTPSSPRASSLPHYLKTIQYRLQRVLAISILRYLFFSFVLSLCFGVYFIGRMDGVWFVAFAWGVFTFDPKNGFEYAFWTELFMWGALECLGIAIPMLLFCMQSVYKTRYDMDKKRGDCWSRWILCSIACITFLIQLLLLLFNFPLHVCFLSVNLVLFPFVSILIPIVFFKK